MDWPSAAGGDKRTTYLTSHHTSVEQQQKNNDPTARNEARMLRLHYCRLVCIIPISSNSSSSGARGALVVAAFCLHIPSSWQWCCWGMVRVELAFFCPFPIVYNSPPPKWHIDHHRRTGRRLHSCRLIIIKRIVNPSCFLASSRGLGLRCYVF